MTTTIDDAGKRLAHLVDKALAGESVVLTRQGNPVAQLIAVQPEQRPWRNPNPPSPGRFAGVDIDVPAFRLSSPLNNLLGIQLT